MKKTINILAAFAVAASVASCNLDLERRGYITYTPGQDIIESESDLNGFEANILACFRGLDYDVLDIASDVMVDYFNATSDFANNYGGIHRADDTFTAGDYDTRDNYSTPYSYIKNFNIFIEGAQSVPAGLEAKAAIVRGEAYTARAFAYLHLVRHFAKPYSANANTDLGVPVVIEYDQTARPERNTVAEVYAQIKSDLDSAAVLLAGVSGSARAQKPTIDVVNALYARYYLDIKDNANAAASAMKVINTGKYAVSATAEEMEAEWLNDNGTEPILQFYASIQEGVGGHSAYTNTNSDPSVGMFYRPYFIPTKKLAEAYEDGDLRLSQWFNAGEFPSFHNGVYYNTDGECDYLTFVKYFGNPALYTSLPNSQQAIKPLLISEMYLIAAEAYLNAGQTEQAREQLNVLQTRRGATPTSATADNIQKEWYKETVGEGLRMSCLKRWGQGYSERTAQDGAVALEVVSTGASYAPKSMPASDYHYQWPIPTYEMQTNLNLIQNEGYAATVAE